ncbi:MAG: hypothetical protein WAV47_08000, partial [Blastocatellia bacterium]
FGTEGGEAAQSGGACFPRAEPFGTDGGEAAQSKGLLPEGRALRHRGRRSRSVEGLGSRGQSPSAQRAAKPLSRRGLAPEGKALRHRGRRSRSVEGLASRGQSPSAQRAAKPLTLNP